MTNETLKTLESRRSCRLFKHEMIKDEELAAVLRAGTFAATGKGAQSPRIVAIKDEATRDLITHMNKEILAQNGGKADGDPFYGAPVIVLVLADADIATHVEDGSLVLGNMMNAAESIGLGSCWVHRARQEFESPIGKAMLLKWGIEGNYVGIGHLALGYAARPAAEPKPRKADYIMVV